MEASTTTPAPTKRMRRLEPAAIAGVMSREVANFRTYWKGTTFSSVLEPIVYLLAFGLGLGATLVDEVEGVHYIQFVGTGMVATAVIFSSALPGDVRHLRQAPLPEHLRSDPRRPGRRRRAGHRGDALDRAARSASTAACR